jgi:hypothetical protein
MSGFLEELVARSTGLSEAIRPRPLSLFEPSVPPGVSSDAPWGGNTPAPGSALVPESVVDASEPPGPVVPRPAVVQAPTSLTPPARPSPASRRPPDAPVATTPPSSRVRPGSAHPTTAVPPPTPPSRVVAEGEAPRRRLPPASLPQGPPTPDPSSRQERRSGRADKRSLPPMPLDIIERLVARAPSTPAPATPRHPAPPVSRRSIERDASHAASLSSLVRQMVLRPVAPDIGGAIAPRGPSRPEPDRATAEGRAAVVGVPPDLASWQAADRAAPAEQPTPAERRGSPPALTPFDWRALAVPAASPSPTTPPTIRVTIGRVEVRAETGTAPSAARPRPAAATMSLDAYLTGRDEGERR